MGSLPTTFDGCSYARTWLDELQNDVLQTVVLWVWDSVVFACFEGEVFG